MPEPDPSPDVAAADPSLSLEVLRHYIGDDPESIREFLTEFQKSAQQHAQSLRVAVSAGEFTRVAMSAHTLKSTARVAGATPLGAILAELENEAKRQDMAAVDRYFGAFLAELSKVEHRLAELLAAR